jgi:quercetin dioxygenase-like cupin family protein
VRAGRHGALVREQFEAARRAPAGRAARTVVGGHENVMRQTVIALLGGRSLAGHESPGEASVHVLGGRVRLVAGEAAWDDPRGDLIVVLALPHSLEALEDAAVLLTVAEIDKQARHAIGGRSSRWSRCLTGDTQAPWSPPAGISAATQMASMVSSPVAPLAVSRASVALDSANTARLLPRTRRRCAGQLLAPGGVLRGGRMAHRLGHRRTVAERIGPGRLHREWMQAGRPHRGADPATMVSRPPV